MVQRRGSIYPARAFAYRYLRAAFNKHFCKLRYHYRMRTYGKLRRFGSGKVWLYTNLHAGFNPIKPTYCIKRFCQGRAHMRLVVIRAGYYCRIVNGVAHL